MMQKMARRIHWGMRWPFYSYLEGRCRSSCVLFSFMSLFWNALMEKIWCPCPTPIIHVPWAISWVLDSHFLIWGYSVAPSEIPALRNAFLLSLLLSLLLEPCTLDSFKFSGPADPGLVPGHKDMFIHVITRLTLIPQDIYDFYSSSPFFLEDNFFRIACSSERKGLCQKQCSSYCLLCLHLVFPIPSLPSLPWQLHLLPYENECYPIPSLQSVCSKRRESRRAWVNFIPGAEPCLSSC